jgi:beta-galactosidase GanA
MCEFKDFSVIFLKLMLSTLTEGQEKESQLARRRKMRKGDDGAMLMSIPLPVQVDMVLEDLTEELCGLKEGTVFLQIEDGVVKTYGVRHRLENRVEPGAERDSQVVAVRPRQVELLREMATDVVKRKTQWTTGMMSYRFVMRKGSIQVFVDYKEQK